MAAARQGKCPQGHLLQQFKTPEGDYGCDLCKERVAAGSVLHGCRTCDFDVCPACQQEQASAVQTDALQPSSSPRGPAVTTQNPAPKQSGSSSSAAPTSSPQSIIVTGDTKGDDDSETGPVAEPSPSLADMGRKELQKMCKELGIKANGKNSSMVQAITKAHQQQRPPPAGDS
jgi:hypothetical protein